MIRPTKSEAPPGANGMIIRTGRLGYPCPSARAGNSASATHASILRFIFSPRLVCPAPVVPAIGSILPACKHGPDRLLPKGLRTQKGHSPVFSHSPSQHAHIG